MGHEDDTNNAYHSLHNTAFLEFAEEENGHRDMQMVEVGACWTRRELSAAEFIAVLLPAEDEHGLPTRDVFSPYVFNAKPGGLEGGMPRANLFPTTVNPLRPPGRRAQIGGRPFNLPRGLRCACIDNGSHACVHNGTNHLCLAVQSGYRHRQLQPNSLLSSFQSLLVLPCIASLDAIDR